MKAVKRVFTEKRIVFLIRWWSVGAVYFFIGWGTQISLTGPIDFIFYLGLSIGVFNMLVVNPVINQMFNVKNRRRYGETLLLDKVLYRIGEIFGSMFIVVMLIVIYNLINSVAIELLGLSAEHIVFAGEPITFGLLYMIVYSLLTGLIQNVKSEVNKRQKWA